MINSSKKRIIFFIVISIIFFILSLNLKSNFDKNKLLAYFLKSLNHENKKENLNQDYSTIQIVEDNSQVTFKEESKIDLNRDQDDFKKYKIGYKESIRVINIFYDKNQSITTSSFKDQNQDFLESLTTTTSIDNLDKSKENDNEKEDEYEEDNIKEPTRGGGSYKKDPCEDYKNKSYPKVLISEVKIGSSENNKDEFVEIYFPSQNSDLLNQNDLDLTCWSLEKYSSQSRDNESHSLTVLIPSSKFKGKIKPNGFFLITSSSTKDKYQADLSYPQSYYISKNNTLVLKNPNGEIVDMVGFGDDKDKIYNFESQPFLGKDFKNKSIHRKNFIDTNNNQKDFWFHYPTPKNSSYTQFPRDDFLDLTELKIDDFNLEYKFLEDEFYIKFYFKEPNLFISSTSNYSYDFLVYPGGFKEDEFNNQVGFNLADFGASSSLPSVNFSGNNLNLSFHLTKCPTTSNTYYFAFFLKDLVDKENFSLPAISSVIFPEGFCELNDNNYKSENIFQKILFSEVRVLEGTSSGEYLELYNPNNFNFDLKGFRIERVSKTGKNYIFISKSKFSNIVLPPFSYLLIVNSSTFSDIGDKADITYPSSYDLSKNNALRLIDENNNLIDEICWGEVNNFSNCFYNPTSYNLSFQRKKTALSSPENIKNEFLNKNGEKIYLGNAYDTDNFLFDFVEAEIDPENLYIKKPTLKEMLPIETSLSENKEIVLKWFSPAFYENDLFYSLSVSTRTDFYNFDTSTLNFINLSPNINLPSFKILDIQEVKFNIDFKDLNLDSDFDFRLLVFKISLQSKNQILDEKFFYFKEE
jgi:hypothetical protein